MPILVIYRGDVEERRLELSTQDVRIGRAAGNDLVLDHDGKSVSRFHAELRHEGGAFVLLDLNSQNGVWIDGRRIQREALGEGTVAVIGPYRLSIQSEHGAAATAPQTEQTAVSAARAKTSDTMVSGRAQPAATAAPRPAARRKPIKPASAPGETTAPGLIGWLLRLPRAVLFGGFLGVCLLIIITGQIVNRKPAAPEGTAPVSVTRTPTEEAPKPSNAEVIATNLSAGNDALTAGRPAEARDRADQVLLVDREHSGALELKAKAENALRAASVSQPLPPVAIEPAGPSSTRKTEKSESKPTPPEATPITPPAVEALPVTRRPGETPRAARARAQSLHSQIEAAKDALRRGQPAEAQSILTNVIRDEPQFPEAAALLEQTKDAERQAQRQATQQAGAQALSEAKRLELSGDWRGAVDNYRRAASLDPAIEVTAIVAALGAKMRTAGEDAFGKAKQYDALGRVPEALASYQRAVQMLPDDHPNRATAQARVTALRATVR